MENTNEMKNNVSNTTPDTLLLLGFKQCNPLSYKQIGLKCFGSKVSKKRVNSLIRDVRRMGYKINTVENFGFLFLGRK